MDTCTNCGATLRPGAKFCTTCGTRLNETPSANDGWGTRRTSAQDDSQETTVLNAVQPQTSKAEESTSINDSQQRSFGQWGSAYNDSTSDQSSSTSDPASRFISALDNEVKPVDEAEGQPSDDPASSWGTPTPAFTPPPPSNWSYSADPVESPAADTADEPDTSADEPAESSWQVPSTWAVVETPDDVDAEDDNAARFTDDGDDLSGDEKIDESESEDALPPNEARDRAIELADELRRTIRMMSGGGESDHGAAVMALTEASLYVRDFADVRGVLVDVKNDPRDIQALTGLAEKVDRIEVLLEEHKSLADTIETAIRELSG